MMPSPKTIFLTGASGFIGRYLLRDLLLEGNRVIVLSRRKGLYSAKDRIEAIVQDWENKLQRRLIRPYVVEGDVREPSCGLSSILGARGAKAKRPPIPLPLRKVDAVLHSAASLRFTLDQSGEEPVRTNLEGVRNAIELAQKLSVPQFHHISTAYVCGKSGDRPVSEDQLDVGQAFQNIYEQSKMQAEELVHQAQGFQTKTIYRPSIVVGDSETGFTSTFSTIYSLLRFLRALPDNSALNTEWILSRLQLTGNEGKNLVSVDWVSKTIVEVLGRPECHNRTIHLTNPIKAAGEHIKEAIKESIVIANEQWQAMASRGQSSVEAINVSDEAFNVHLEAYRGYMADDPNFKPSQLSEQPFWQTPPLLDKANLVKLFVYAINSRFRDSTPNPFPTKDGTVSGMDYALPIETWIEQYLEKLESQKLKSDSESIDFTSFHLKLAGLGGGIWEISKEATLKTISNSTMNAFVHMAVENWCELLQGNLTVAELLNQKKMVLATRKEDWQKVLALLDELILDSHQKWKLHSVSDIPSVLPIEQHRKGGRRLA